MSLAYRHFRGKVPWIIKYRPKRVEDVVNQDTAKKVLVSWIKEWLSGKPPSKRAALLYGPPGVGKTSLVEAIANEYKLEVVELNASDYRRASDIRRVVGSAAFKKPLWGRGIIILLDEIDGISAKEDAGGLSELLHIIPRTANPIVMTANDPWKDALKPLREHCLLVEFKELGLTHIVAILQRICDAEGLYCEREALRYIAEKAEGDVRAAINDLQAVAEGYGKVTLSLVKALVRGREKSVNLWRTLTAVFYSKYAWQVKRAISNSEEDYETLIAWINDNIPRRYSDVEDYYRAYEALARATLFLTRAKLSDWSLLSYVFDLMGPGVTFARKHPHAKMKYAYPERIKLLARLKETRETREHLAEKLASRLLTSKATVKNEVIPVLHFIFREAPSPIPAAKLALGYQLTEKEVKFLAGHRASEVLKAIEKIKRARAAEAVEAEASRGEGKPVEAARRPVGLFGEPLEPQPSKRQSTKRSRSRSRTSRRRQGTLF
ncbi:replication factor C large subunit [Stetteria hydrogenophila]